MGWKDLLKSRCLFFTFFGMLEVDIIMRDIWVWYNLLMDGFGGILFIGRMGVNIMENW